MQMIDGERRILEWIMDGAIYLICLGKHPAKARQARTAMGKCLISISVENIAIRASGS